MYLLTKSILAAMLGFISAVVLGFILIPILKKMHAGKELVVMYQIGIKPKKELQRLVV